MAPLAIAQVSPYPWEDRHEVNTYVARLSEELAQRGHRVVIVAPSRDEAAVRASRRAIRAGDVLGAPGEVRVLAVGEVLPGVTGAASSGRGRPAVPIDVARTIEDLLLSTRLDICHVHEPFAPSVASVALRHSRTLNVGTFHAPAERLVATQVARKLVTLVFGRLDARHAAFPATAALMARFFPAEYLLAEPGADALEPATRNGDAVRLVFVDVEERQALRLFLRALRRLELSVPWEATVISAQGPSSSTPMSAELRARVTFTTDGEDAALARADVIVAASGGTLPAPALVLRATAAGAVPVVSRLPVYEDLVHDHGLLFEPGDVEVLGAQLRRVVGDAGLRRR
ncbi:MAG: glycosyltransferase, partial [Conexibacter sp.]|nr:glycosyltransferase [Conexibacter sp.]